MAGWAGLPGAANAQHDDGHEHSGDGHVHAGIDATEVPLYNSLGNHSRTITTTSSAAQAYFDQGLRLQYAFNHAEAIRAYEKALSYDAECAMCWWGIALASGPNINAPMDEASGRRAFDAIQKADELSKSGGSTVERRLIEALAARYDANPAADRAPLDRAYAQALEQLVSAYPDDSDMLTLHGASLMNLNPWNYWSGGYGDRKPNNGTPELLASLERALELSPNNPGACHYFIHAVEAAYPERAVECADRLAALMPGAGHIVHMPGHIYIRVGRYRDAVTANDHAVHSDESFIADQSPMGLYPMAYYPHNYHFMAFAATMAGMGDKAMEAANKVAPRVPFEVAQQVYWLQNAVVLPQLTGVTFGRWEDVLAVEMPHPELGPATAMALYARGTSLAALGRDREAAAERSRLAELATEIDPSDENPVVQIALLALDGELALRSGNASDAVSFFESAATIEDEMLYEEPPLWYYPIRHSLGRALLEAGRPADAERVYRYDLLRFPDNGWSLYGLAQSLEQQGKRSELADVKRRFKAAWSGADVELTASRF